MLRKPMSAAERTTESVELNDAELEKVAGGTAGGPDLCPKCGSYNVGYSAQARAAICFDCGTRM